jgi:hypothetical protein
MTPVTLMVQAPFDTPEGECRRVVHVVPPCDGARAWVEWRLPDGSRSWQRARPTLQFRTVGAWTDEGALL